MAEHLKTKKPASTRWTTAADMFETNKIAKIHFTQSFITKIRW